MPLPLPPQSGARPISGPRGGAVNVQRNPSGLAMFFGNLMQSLQGQEQREREEARAELQQIQNLMSLGLTDQIDWKKAGKVAKKAGLDKFFDFSKPADQAPPAAGPPPSGGPAGPSPPSQGGAGSPSQQGGPGGMVGALKSAGKALGGAFGLDFGGVHPQSQGVQMLQQMAPLLAERGKLETLRGKAETKVLENQMALLAGDPDALRNMAKANAVNNPQLAAHLMAGKSFDEAAEAFLERPEIKLMEKELELKRDQMGFDRQIQAETMAINMQKMFPLAKYSLLKSYADSRLLGNQSAAMAYMSVISASPSAYALEAETEAAKAELATRQFEAQQEAALREYNLAVITMANEATQGQAKMFAELAFNPDVPSDQRDSAMEGLADALSRAGSIQVPIGDTAIRLGPDVVAKRFTDWWSILPGGSRFRGTRLELAPSAGEVERKEAGEAPEPTSELWQMFTYTEEEKKALKKLIPQLPLGAPGGFGLPL